MERPRLTLIVLMYVLLCSQRRISGEEVKMKVRPGENITLYCDCTFTAGFFIVWIRNCFHEKQPSLIMDFRNVEETEHFSFIHNPVNNSVDLHITNISVSHLGLYYCAETENKVNKDEKGIISGSMVYYYGKRTTRLSFAETSCSELSNITSTPPRVSECVFCWNLLFSLCSVCVLLFSICVFCLCQRKTTGSTCDQKDKLRKRHFVEENGDQEVCYASLNKRTIRQIQPKITQEESSNFSTYSQVRIDTE